MNKLKALENYKKYLETYSGKSLLKKHSLDEDGVWKIRGEDPNCDMGGPHIMPELGIVNGKLRDVVMYGVNLPGFWNWGAGGDFTLIGRQISTIDENSLEAREALKEEAKELEERLKELKRQLGEK